MISADEAVAPEDETAIIQPETETANLIEEYVEITETGARFKKKPPFKKWLVIAEFPQAIRSRSQWWIGDVLNYGEDEYGEKYAQAVDEHGKSESRLQTYASVCRRFEPSRRRREVSFDHHAECAALLPQEADRVLAEAIKMRWSKMDVRAERIRIQEQSGQAPKPKRKTGTVAKIAASGKTPEPAETILDLTQAPAPATPEPQPAPTGKGFFWNGHPVTTHENALYYATERMEDDEADRCAHHHNFAHKEMMMRALRGLGLSTVFPKGQPEAPEPASSAPTDPGAYDHAKAMNRVAGAIADLKAATDALDFEKVTVLDAKKLLKLSIPFDDAIDRWQKIEGKTPAPR